MATYSLHLSEAFFDQTYVQPDGEGAPWETVVEIQGATIEQIVQLPRYRAAVHIHFSNVVFTPAAYQFPPNARTIHLNSCSVPGPFPFPGQLIHLTIQSMNLGFPLVVGPPLETLELENCQLPDVPVIPETVRYLKMNLMTIAGGFMEHLPVLPAELRSLEAETNGLVDLPPLPVALTSLRVSENLLTELPALPPTLRLLIAHTNRLTELPALPANLVLLTVYSNQLQSLPLPLPPNLEIKEEGLMDNPWNPLFTWFYNRYVELYDQLGWQQERQIQRQIRQELNAEIQRLANIRQRGKNVSAAQQVLSKTAVPSDILSEITSFLSGKSGSSKQQTLRLREEATRPHGGPGVQGGRRRRKTKTVRKRKTLKRKH